MLRHVSLMWSRCAKICSVVGWSFSLVDVTGCGWFLWQRGTTTTTQNKPAQNVTIEAISIENKITHKPWFLLHITVTLITFAHIQQWSINHPPLPKVPVQSLTKGGGQRQQLAAIRCRQTPRNGCHDEHTCELSYLCRFLLGVPLAFVSCVWSRSARRSSYSWAQYLRRETVKRSFFLHSRHKSGRNSSALGLKKHMKKYMTKHLKTHMKKYMKKQHMWCGIPKPGSWSKL